MVEWLSKYNFIVLILYQPIFFILLSSKCNVKNFCGVYKEVLIKCNKLGISLLREYKGKNMFFH